MLRRNPQVQVLAEAAALQGGLDLISPPGYAKAGTCRFALNYEQELGGGYRRIGGYERFSGKPRPHEAAYVPLAATAGFTGLTVGDAVTGSVTGATGVVCYVAANLIAVTKVGVTPFAEGDHIMVAAVDKGIVTDTEPPIDGFLDNELSHLASAIYRLDIAAPAGASGVRGVAVLNNEVYCWRDNAGASVIYKATPTGWVVVPLYSQISFDGGSAKYAEGSTITQGGTTATVKRVVTETGDWLAGTAAGRLIIDPIAGAFVAGASGGGGICNLLGPAAQIVRSGGGRVQTVQYNFTASLNTKRLYGCDGINAEFEFDGDILAPLTVGMGAVRARHVACFRNHLFYLFNGSLQHSGIGLPYTWSPIFGAAELGTGDVGTGMVTVSGSEDSAALMVGCKDSVWVLYGSSAANWKFQRIADEAGMQAHSMQPFASSPISFDRESFNASPATDTFGNFKHESASRQIDPLVRNAVVKASVLVKNRSMYRCFFSDGLFVTGTFTGGGWAWMPCNYGFTVECAVGAEIDGEYRVFYGGADGMVYEADVGRSFDGQEVEAGMRLSSQNQRSGVMLKQYRHVEMESQTESAFELAVAAEFSDSDPDAAGVSTVAMTLYRRVYGAGLFWDFESWDQAYWDAALANRVRYPIHGQGRSISILVRSLAANELPHTIKSMTLLYTPRRIAR